MPPMLLLTRGVLTVSWYDCLLAGQMYSTSKVLIYPYFYLPVVHNADTPISDMELDQLVCSLHESQNTFHSIMNNRNDMWDDPAMAIHIVCFYPLQFITHSHPLPSCRLQPLSREMLIGSSPCKTTLNKSIVNICCMVTLQITKQIRSSSSHSATQLSSS